MFFEKELISLRILGVVELKQSPVSHGTSGRKFDALSFRFSSDVQLKTDAQTHCMQDNTVAFVPAGITYTRSGSHDDLIAVHFDMQDEAEYDVETLRPRNAAAMRELFCRLLACWKSRETGYQYQCTAILYEILALCRRQTGQEQTRDRIQPSVDYLEQNWNQPEVNIGDAAKQSFMSEVYFRKLFKARFGISPLKYLVQLRVQKAADLMQTGYYTLKEIAFLCGYRDYKYFSVEFKRLMGCTPSEFAAKFH